ncbi:MAG: ZIP family metal transporter [Clostridia bacterium]|jgi:ZIP family zinc transporter|nr:ZIP family metal transporter [Clostridia bacterium]
MMENILYSVAGILIPFIGTSFGSSLVLFMKQNINEKFQKLLVGFASGVMIAASIWSLILPSVEMAENQGIMPWIPASVGFLLGVIFLIIINKVAEKIEEKKDGKKLNMLIFSVTLHNIPEGMAVGVCFAGFLAGNAGIALIEAIILAIGIAIQNIPEGAIISMPLKMKGLSKKKAFLCGVLSGAVEPIAAFITVLLINIIVPILPYLLSFAAGAMIFVVVEELVPEMHQSKKSVLGVIGVTFGFIVMMVLDIALG